MKTNYKLLILMIFISQLIFAQQFIPTIENISLKDIYFKQLYFDIETAYKSSINNTPPPRMHIYMYKTKKSDDFFRITASFSTQPQTFATLNNLLSPSDFKNGVKYFISNRQGLFIPINKKGNRLVQFIRHVRYKELIESPIVKINEVDYYFLENEYFSAIEQAFFLKILYNFPVDDGVLTSSFGSRIHPITNRETWHKGIDIAASKGANVYSANHGTVEETGYDKTYGNYIIIKHLNGYETFYAHLSKIKCDENIKIEAGDIIGLVGSTGLSTGSHLHFEIRKDGKALNPNHFLKN